MDQRREWAYSEGKVAFEEYAMKRGALVLSIVLIAAILALAVISAAESGRPATQDGMLAPSILRAFCAVNLKRDDVSCSTWAFRTMAADPARADAVIACDRAQWTTRNPGKFVACLARAGIAIPE